jgi:SNF2 family DNA or RNA helicase
MAQQAKSYRVKLRLSSKEKKDPKEVEMQKRIDAAMKLAEDTVAAHTASRFPYQTEGVKWMLSREFDETVKGGFLADEMGLGKTYEAIRTMRGNPVSCTLIVTMPNVMTQWRCARHYRV